MARQFNYQVQGGREQLPIQTLVFVLCLTLSLLAAIIFFCADGLHKNSKRNSEDNNNGSACTAGCGSACGGGCGG